MSLVPLGHGWRPLIERATAAASGSSAAAPVTNAAIDALCTLLDRVVEWNRRFDLTAARSADELVDLYVADALALLRGPWVGGERWVDVGSGAGAPAVTLALLAPELSLTLVEPRAKRVAFLRSALGELGRADVEVRRARSDGLEAGSFDVAVSRATLPPGEWLPEGTRIARRAVWVLLARGAPPAADGWRLDVDHAYRWPLTGAERRALRFVR